MSSSPKPWIAWPKRPRPPDDAVRASRMVGGPSLQVARRAPVRSCTARVLAQGAAGGGTAAFRGGLLAAYYFAVDRATPGQVKAALLGAPRYFVLPVDAVPDVLPGGRFPEADAG